MIIQNDKDGLKKTDEKALLIMIIGSLESIKMGAVSIDEAEKFLFSPYMVDVLRSKSCNEEIVSIIEKGCELEDIYDLIPHQLNLIIDELIQKAVILAKNYEEFKKSFWIRFE